jgi:hypothetical protein
MKPSSPPTSATSSDATVRPCDLEDIRGILNQIRDREDALLDLQRSTNRQLDDLRDYTLNDKLQSLNEWFERDVHDRRAELRGISARVDQLRDDIGRLVGQPQD